MATLGMASIAATTSRRTVLRELVICPRGIGWEVPDMQKLRFRSYGRG